MFNRLTDQQRRAVERCKAPEMAAFLDMLTAALAAAQGKIAVADTFVEVSRLQGQIAVLSGLLGAINAR